MFGGSPDALKVTVPTGGFVARVAEKTKVAAFPAVTVEVLFPLGVTATRKIFVVSDTLLLLKLASTIPPTLAELISVGGASVATFTVIETGG